jgi:hypothetical protein
MDKQLYMYQVDKTEVIHKDFSGILKLLRFLDANKESTYQSLYLGFSGYDDIPDELFEIKAVRAWVQALVRKVPYLLYFINFEINSHVHVIGCLGDVDSILVGESRTPMQMAAEGKHPDQYGKRYTMIYFYKDFIDMMKQSISAYCRDTGNRVAEAELLAKIAYHTPD